MTSDTKTPNPDEQKPLQSVMQTLGGIELSAGVYMLLTILSGGVVALRVVDFGADWLLLILGVLLAAMLFFRIWLIGMIYLAVLVFLNHTESRYVAPGSTPLDSGELAFAVACLGFVVFASRYIAMMSPIRTYGTARSTWRESFQFLKDLVRPREEAPKPPARMFDPGCQLGRRQKEVMKPEELLSSCFRIVIGVSAAVAILQYVPLRPEYNARSEFGLTGPAVRLITIAWLIITALLVMRFVTGPVRRSQSRREAELFLRSEATRGLFSELRSMVVRLVKHRQKTFVRRLADPVIKNEPVKNKQAPRRTPTREGRPRGTDPPPSATPEIGHSTSELKKKLKRTR